MRLRVRPVPAAPVRDEAFFLELIKALFAQRRKTILNNLRAARGRLGLKDEAEISRALAAASLAPPRRAESLAIPEIAQLADRITEIKTRNAATLSP
jgi:16S rRNA (adenine1518-N6/adenine1519-N6)-dimethyltransferase